MPIYEYKCQECGADFELFIQSTQAESNPVCPKCDTAKITKVLSAPAAVSVGGIRSQSTTCCGRDERCETPPCSSGESCRRDDR